MLLVYNQKLFVRLHDNGKQQKLKMKHIAIVFIKVFVAFAKSQYTRIKYRTTQHILNQCLSQSIFEIIRAF